MKQYCSPIALCPYYRDESAGAVGCQGVSDQSYLRLSFDNRSAAFGYKRSRCKKSYRLCPVYRMLAQLYDDLPDR